MAPTRDEPEPSILFPFVPAFDRRAGRSAVLVGRTEVAALLWPARQSRSVLYSIL
jgi:hypothetical protein